MAEAAAALRSALRAALPAPLAGLARGVDALAWRWRCEALDAFDALSGRRDPLVPPRRMWEWVTGRSEDFARSGAGELDLMRAHGLEPRHAVLDVGCGIGRAAIPLTRYLSGDGSYDGFDIMPEAIAWCRDAITPRFPRFRFHVADVRSDRYNPHGATPASRYVFPFPDESFDFVFLGSVFTHMFPADMAGYLAEIARVMRPGARAVISWYLIDDEARAGVAAGSSALTFSVAGEGCRTERADLPEAAVAFERSGIERLYAALGLEIVALERGSWSRSRAQGQDIVAAVKSAHGS